MNKYVKIALMVLLLGVGTYFGIDLTPIAKIVQSASVAPSQPTLQVVNHSGDPDAGN
jgi:hypothetical protein